MIFLSFPPQFAELRVMLQMAPKPPDRVRFNGLFCFEKSLLQMCCKKIIRVRFENHYLECVAAMIV